jgi:pyruvate dehydrogenase E1 component alpha subunit
MITKDEMIGLFRTMLTIRLTEEKIVSEYKKGYMKCPVHLYVGEEAVAAAVITLLDRRDYVTTTHRSHGHYLAKGGDILNLLKELCGLEDGYTKGWGGSQHIFAPDIGIMGTSAIVGSGISIATGIALGIKMEDLNEISVCFFGDGATEEGYFYESLNFASLKNLPVLYVCENNGLATHSRIENRRGEGVEIYKIAASLGVESKKIDGNDVIEFYEVSKNAVKYVRDNKKPYFIEALTYRWKGHVSPEEDFGERYRDKNEIELWKEKCPIINFERKILNDNLISKKELETVKSEVYSIVEENFFKLNNIMQNKQNGFVPVTPY